MGKNFESFIGCIVNSRKIIIIVFAVLSAVCIGLKLLVEVNYDLTSYLPNDSRTKKSYDLMKREFESTGTAGLIIGNISKEDSLKAEKIINKIEGVSICKMSNYNSSANAALINIFLKDGDYTKEAEKCLNDIVDGLKKDLSGHHDYYKVGIASTAVSTRKSIEKELPLVLLIAVVFVILVLLVTTKSFFEPVVLIIVIFSAIILNFGTDLILRKISFISNAISAVLLVALSMDYSIVLVSRFNEEQEKKPGDDVAAMKKALSGAFITITSSGFTVLAGILSLIFMKNKVGLDMGLVLAKGVLISIISVVFLMPSLLLACNKLIKKTEHKRLLRGLDKIGTCAKVTQYFIPPIFLALGIAAVVVESKKLDITYLAELGNDEIRKADKKATDLFGIQNSFVAIIPFDADIKTQIEIANTIKNWGEPEDGIFNSMASYFTTVVPITEDLSLSFSNETSKDFLINTLNINEEVVDLIFEETKPKKCPTPDAIYLYELLETTSKPNVYEALSESSPIIAGVLSLANEKIKVPADKFFRSEDKSKYIRMMSNIKSHPDSKEAFDAVNTLKEQYLDKLMKEGLIKDYFIVCNTENGIETKDIFKSDKLKVELISTLAVLIIVMIALKSGLIPFVLVIAIFGSIMLNLAFNALIGNKIYYICFLLGHAIQMGATIDYGILLTDRYLMARKKETKYEAIKSAIVNSFTTIISSGSILCFAALTIGLVCTVQILKEIGFLISLGGVFATLTMLFVLPQALLLLDKLIYYTTYKPNFVEYTNSDLTDKLTDDTNVNKDGLFEESITTDVICTKEPDNITDEENNQSSTIRGDSSDDDKKTEEKLDEEVIDVVNVEVKGENKEDEKKEENKEEIKEE